MLNLAVIRVVVLRKVGVHGALWPGSWNQPIADRQYTDINSAQQQELKVTTLSYHQEDVCV